MLQEMRADGTFRWECPHCKAGNSAHISHDEVMYGTQAAFKMLLEMGFTEEEAHSRVMTTMPDKGEDSVVTLPKCACGSQTSVRVVFSEGELAPAIIHRDSTGRITQIQLTKDSLHEKHYHLETLANGRTIPVIHDVTPHPSIAPHQELARQLEAIGKRPRTRKI